jgi:hypothetical protein
VTGTLVHIRLRAPFGPLALVGSTGKVNIELGSGLGAGVFHAPYSRAFFKEGYDDGCGQYSICFANKKIAILIMSNNDNGESIFKELLEYAMGDIYMSWQLKNYIPYGKKN